MTSRGDLESGSRNGHLPRLRHGMAPLIGYWTVLAVVVVALRIVLG